MLPQTIIPRTQGSSIRLSIFFRAIAGGNLTGAIRLRKNDYLKEDAELISQMMDSLGGRIREISYSNERLQSRIADLRAALEGGEAGEIQGRLEDLERTASRLRTDLRVFTLEGER